MKQCALLLVSGLLVACAPVCSVSHLSGCKNLQDPSANFQTDYTFCKNFSERLGNSYQTLSSCMRDKGWPYGNLDND